MDNVIRFPFSRRMKPAPPRFLNSARRHLAQLIVRLGLGFADAAEVRRQRELVRQLEDGAARARDEADERRMIPRTATVTPIDAARR
jgi:hypothetical protein